MAPTNSKKTPGVAIEAKELEVHWLPMLQQKKPGFCWSGQDYAKTVCVCMCLKISGQAFPGAKVQAEIADSCGDSADQGSQGRPSHEPKYKHTLLTVVGTQKSKDLRAGLHRSQSTSIIC